MPGNQYDFYSGSSIAAAYVSGIAALAREIQPKIRNVALRELLARTSAQTASTPGSRIVVNACAAIADLVGRSECPATVAKSATPDRPSLVR